MIHIINSINVGIQEWEWDQWMWYETIQSVGVWYEVRDRRS